MTESLKSESIRIVAEMAVRILKTEKFYIPKMVDAFERLSEEVQEAMLRFFVQEVGSTAWESLLRDKLQHRRLLTYVLFNFTGNQLRGEPSKEELADHLRNFVRSTNFKDALSLKETEEMFDEIGK
jgi:hypothetical protein